MQLYKFISQMAIMHFFILHIINTYKDYIVKLWTKVSIYTLFEINETLLVIY